MSVNSLPVELILHIYSFLDLSSHLNFALTSRQVAHHSQDVLDHHRRCYEVCDTFLDWNAGNTWSMLLQIARDPIRAWHLRTLESRVFDDGEQNGLVPISHSNADSKVVDRPLRDAISCLSQGKALEEDFLNAVEDSPPRLSNTTITMAVLLLCRRVNTIKFSRFPDDPEFHEPFNDPDNEPAIL